ncbi:MAG: hypothetical protein WA029_21335 [Anaerolineae bacterium]
MTAQTTAQTTALSAKMTALDKVWAAIALLTPLWLAFLTPLQRLDVWWHLKVGEAIVQTGQIPTVDIYSFTANGTPYGYANVWLADVIFYGLYRSGGPALLIGMTGLLLCAACGLSWHLAFQRSASARLATVASLAGAVLIIRFGAARPQIFSIILFALFFWLLGQARARGQGRWLWPLPPLMALWANLHGAFPLGLLLIVFFLGEGLLRYGFKQPLPAERRLLLALAACLLASVAAAGVNPAGYAVFSTVQGIMGAPAVQQLALEWQAQDIKLGADLPFFALCALTFLALIYTPSRPWIGDVLLLGGFCALGLSARRHGVWLALIAPPLVAGYLAQWPWPARPTRVTKRTDAPVTHGQGAPRLLIGVLLLLTLLLSPWVRPRLPNQRLGYGLLDARTPVAAVEYMAEQGVQGRVFHPQWFGDYLLWRLSPAVQVFLDGRVHLYDWQTWRNHSAILNAWDWERLLADYQISWVLLDTADPTQTELRAALRASPRWRLRYADDVALLFGRAP